MSGIVFILDGYMLINMCILCVAMKTSPNYKGPSSLNSQQQYEWEDLVVGAHVGPLTLCLHVTTGCMIECCLALSQVSKSGNYQAGCHIKKKTLKANISIMCSSSRRKYAKIMHVSHTHYNFCPQVVHGAQIAACCKVVLTIHYLPAASQLNRAHSLIPVNAVYISACLLSASHSNLCTTSTVLLCSTASWV